MSCFWREESVILWVADENCEEVRGKLCSVYVISPPETSFFVMQNN
jgi:hypothetical protein